MNTTEAARRWNTSEEYVRQLLRAGRIPGASRDNGHWQIPDGLGELPTRPHKLSEEQREEVGRRASSGESLSELGREYGIDRSYAFVLKKKFLQLNDPPEITYKVEEHPNNITNVQARRNALKRASRARQTAFGLLREALSNGQTRKRVYFVESVRFQALKVGASSNVGRRLQELKKTEEDDFLILRCDIPNLKGLEPAIHLLLSSNRMEDCGREWFKLSPSVNRIVRVCEKANKSVFAGLY